MKKALRALLAGFFFSCLLFAACGQKVQKEKEPNDTLETANLMRAGIPACGELSDPEDRDALRFDVEAGKLFSFVLEHDSRSTLSVDVYRSGKFIKRVPGIAAKDSPGASGSAHASFLDARGGDIILLIRAAAGENAYPASWRLTTELTSSDSGMEREPNDTPEEATPIGHGQIVEGRYSPATVVGFTPVPSLRIETDGYERDFYEYVNATTNRIILEVEISGVPNVDAVLEIYDDQGRISKTIDTQGIHYGEASGPIGLEPHTACIFAFRGKYQGNPHVSYRVRASARIAGTDEEFEPNDILEMANPLVPGEAMRGRIFPDNDADYFRLPLAAAGRYTISARLSPTGDADLKLDLLNEQNSVLLSVNDEPAGKAEYIANYGFTAMYDAMFLFLRVRAEPGARDPGYSIAASDHPAGAFAEFEHNNIRARANPLMLGVEMRGYFFPAGDRDWFNFDLEEERVLSLRLAAPTGLKASIRIEDSGGRVVSATPSPSAGEVRLRTPRLREGSYYLLLMAEDGGNPRDPWVLRVTPEEE